MTVLFLIRVTNARSLLFLKTIAGGDSALMLQYSSLIISNSLGIMWLFVHTSPKNVS